MNFDFINVVNVTIDNSKFFYIPEQSINTRSSVLKCFPWLSMNAHTGHSKIKEVGAFKEKKIVLNYILNNEEDLLDVFIDKLLENLNTDYPEELKIQKIDSIGEKDIKNLFNKISHCSNYIAANNGMGCPGTFIILNQKYIELFYKYNITKNEYISNLKIIPTKKIDNKIIIGRKKIHDFEFSLSNIFNLFINKKTNRYSIEGVGDFNSQYHILEIKYLKEERKKKLKEIIF